MKRIYFLSCRGCTKKQYLRLRALMDYFVRSHGYSNNERRFKGMKTFRFRVMKDVERIYKKKILT